MGVNLLKGQYAISFCCEKANRVFSSPTGKSEEPSICNENPSNNRLSKKTTTEEQNYEV